MGWMTILSPLITSSQMQVSVSSCTQKRAVTAANALDVEVCIM